MRPILIAVDGSGQSDRAVEYAGALLRDTPGVRITLFHVLKPIPREFLEHGGSENPQGEEKLSKKLRTEQEEDAIGSTGRSRTAAEINEKYDSEFVGPPL